MERRDWSLQWHRFAKVAHQSPFFAKLDVLRIVGTYIDMPTVRSAKSSARRCNRSR